MSGMSSLAGYSFTQLAPTQLTPYAVATSSTATTTACVLQQQLGSSSTTTAVMHPDDITMKNELPGQFVHAYILHMAYFLSPIMLFPKHQYVTIGKYRFFISFSFWQDILGFISHIASFVYRHRRRQAQIELACSLCFFLWLQLYKIIFFIAINVF